MPSQARLTETADGLRPEGDGWYVVNARDARWYGAPGRSSVCDLEGEPRFAQFGTNLSVLMPGEAMGMYHSELDQEAFLLLSGAAILVVEGEERPLRPWDFFHCPAGVAHMIVGAGEGPALLLSIGGREFAEHPEGLSYPPDDLARRHGVSVDAFTHSAGEAYADTTPRGPVPFREDWLSR